MSVESTLGEPAKRAFVVLDREHSTSGSDAVRAAIEAAFGSPTWRYTVYQTTGNDNVRAIVGGAVADGYDLVVAVGGDRVISRVAGPLVGANVPLGILPVGAANVFSRALGIPADLAGAAALWTGRHARRTVDVMSLGDTYALIFVEIGLGSRMRSEADSEEPRQFGRWTPVQTLFDRLRGNSPQRFSVVADGELHRPLARRILIANVGTLDVRTIRHGPTIRSDDSALDVCLVDGRTTADLGRHLRYVLSRRGHSGSRMRSIKATISVSVATDPPLPVLADGETIGTTPVQITLLPQALEVVVPAK